MLLEFLELFLMEKGDVEVIFLNFYNYFLMEKMMWHKVMWHVPLIFKNIFQ
jgi:hypothetical protein